MSAGQAAAKFWADFLRTRPTHDVGDDRLSGLVTYLSSHFNPLDAKGIDKFESILADKFNELWNARKYLHIGTDYHPDELLAKAAEEAGLGNLFGMLPFKTDMWLDPEGESLQVKCGYGASIEDLKYE